MSGIRPIWIVVATHHHCCELRKADRGFRVTLEIWRSTLLQYCDCSCSRSHGLWGVAVVRHITTVQIIEGKWRCPLLAPE
jgi:hypothetical protein